MKKILVLAAAGLVAIAGAVPTIASATETEPQQFVTALWQSTSEEALFPQSLVAWVVLPKASLSALDGNADCGQYQADVYDYTTPADVAQVNALIAAGSMSSAVDGSLLARDAMQQPYKVFTATAGCEVVVPPVEEPPVDTPTPPVVEEAPPAGPVTPESPKDLTALSDDERAGVEQFADAHGIAPEEVLVEMG